MWLSDLFSSSEVSNQAAIAQELQVFTDDFLAPFREAFAYEDRDGLEVPWIKYTQRLLFDLVRENKWKKTIRSTWCLLLDPC